MHLILIDQEAGLLNRGSCVKSSIRILDNIFESIKSLGVAPCVQVGFTVGLQPFFLYLSVDTQSRAELSHHSYHGTRETDQNHLSLVLFL